MCVFVDPKSSIVKIIQNIGRIVRKQFGVDKPNSTILIPCWVDKTKYERCNGVKEECDKVIREDMSAGGNFSGILNVMSALQQEQPDVYDLCMNYPDTYTYTEIESNFIKQGYKIDDVVGEGTLQETIEYIIDKEVEDEDIDDISKNANVCIEVYTDLVDEPLTKYNEKCDGDVVRMYKGEDDTYQPIIKSDGIKKCCKMDKLNAVDKQQRVNVNFHSNGDVKVLWNIDNWDCDLNSGIKSCLLKCEVVDVWGINLEKLKEFFDTNKKTPGAKSKNKDEKVIGAWLNNQNHKYKNRLQGMKNYERYGVWTAFLEQYSEYVVSIDDVWDTNFDKLKEFIDKNKRRPSEGSENKDEKFIVTWLNNQNKNHKNRTHGMKNNERYDAWTAFLELYIDYSVSYDDVWDINFDKLKEFIDKNKRRPTDSSKNKDEKIIGAWLGTQNHKYKNRLHGMKNNERYGVWTAFLEQYHEYFVSSDDVWDTNFDKLKEFIDSNKKTPSSKSKNKDESFIGRWLVQNNKNYRNRLHGMKNNERYDIWCSFLEQYNEYFNSIDDLWDTNFNKLKEFIDENKKTPSGMSKNNNEKIIGTWLGTQNKNYKNITDGMKNNERHNIWGKFLEAYKEYFISNDDVWDTNFDNLKKFIDSNKKTPSTTSKNKDEKFLMSWLGTQQQYYRNRLQCCMKNDVRYDAWTAFLEQYSEYLVSIDDVWDTNFDKLKEFIDKNKRRPSKESKNEDEKFIGSWLCTQNKNHKNRTQGMKNGERYNVWCSFIKQYNEYFVSNDDLWDTNFYKLKEFIDENKKPPSTISKNGDEKIIGNWLSNQNRSYKKRTEGMKNDERYDLWTTFKNDKIPENKPIKSMSLVTLRKIKEKTEETPENKRVRTKSQMEILHKRYKTLTSSNLNKEFKENTQLWNEYHEISEKNEESFPENEIPRNKIIQELDKLVIKRKRTVVDMGCGKGQISKYFTDKNDKRFQFINYDHISSDNSVISCDISNVPLEDGNADMVILSLAMWGSNCKSYIAEANRILDLDGKLYIIEATKRWSDKDENHNLIQGEEGGKLKQLLVENNFQILESEIKKFSMFTCRKIN
jgi:hypothetical protein